MNKILFCYSIAIITGKLTAAIRVEIVAIPEPIVSILLFFAERSSLRFL